MPYYDFRCRSCTKNVRLFIAYSDYDEAQPECPACKGKDLQRRVARVMVVKSSSARIETMMNEPEMAGLEDEDPRALGQFMRKMSDEMGEDMGEEFNEVVERLEKGESPESIESSMPDQSNDLPVG